MYVNYMQIDTSYKPGSPSQESWASTPLSEANQHQHHSDMLFQSHPTNPAAPEVVLTCSCCLGLVNPICDMGFLLKKPDSSCDEIRMSNSSLGSGLSDKALGRKENREEDNMARSQTSLLLPPHIQNYPAWYLVSAKVCLRLRNFNSKSIKERRWDLQFFQEFGFLDLRLTEIQLFNTPANPLLILNLPMTFHQINMWKNLTQHQWNSSCEIGILITRKFDFMGERRGK